MASKKHQSASGLDSKWRERVAEVLKTELAEPERFHWLSFADDSKGGFQGAVMIKAHGITDALMKINLLGINPGGEVSCIEIPEEEAHRCTEDVINRILSRAEIDLRWGLMTLSEYKERNK